MYSGLLLSRDERPAMKFPASGATRRGMGGSRVPPLRVFERAAAHLRARVVLSRRRVSCARVLDKRERHGEGRPAQSSRPLSVGTPPWRRRLHRAARRRPRRSYRVPSPRGPARSDHARRSLERGRPAHSLRGRCSRRRRIKLSVAEPRDTHIAGGAGGNRRGLGKTASAPARRPPRLERHRIRGFNVLPIVEFNKPSKYWDGTETLSYSYRLNASYHPRYRYADDVRARGRQGSGPRGGGRRGSRPGCAACPVREQRSARAGRGLTAYQSLRNIHRPSGPAENFRMA